MTRAYGATVEVSVEDLDGASCAAGVDHYLRAGVLGGESDSIELVYVDGDAKVVRRALLVARASDLVDVDAATARNVEEGLCHAGVEACRATGRIFVARQLGMAAGRCVFGDLRCGRTVAHP